MRIQKILNIPAVALMLLSSSVPGIANAISFDISWAGANGYTMSGTFSYADSLISTGVIDENAIATLMIEGFQNGSSIGTWNLTDSSSTVFNFNFDTDSQSFIVGGKNATTTGQAWNYQGASGLGFASGDINQLFSLNGDLVNDSIIPTGTALIATPSIVPVPAAMWLFGTGLLGLIGIARHKKTAQ